MTRSKDETHGAQLHSQEYHSPPLKLPGNSRLGFKTQDQPYETLNPYEFLNQYITSLAHLSIITDVKF